MDGMGGAWMGPVGRRKGGEYVMRKGSLNSPPPKRFENEQARHVSLQFCHVIDRTKSAHVPSNITQLQVRTPRPPPPPPPPPQAPTSPPTRAPSSRLLRSCLPSCGKAWRAGGLPVVCHAMRSQVCQVTRGWRKAEMGFFVALRS